MKLSIIIPCRDDPKLAECVHSIDEDVEILVVLNGSPPEFTRAIEQINDDRIRIQTLARPNLSRALEVGIRAARYDHVLLMDSDCVFAPGAISQVDAALAANQPSHQVYKGRVVFDQGKSYASALVARSRTERMAGPLNAFKPPLAFSREIMEALGGYFFDPRLIWKEDADFNQRVRRAGIGIVGVDGCIIHHAALSMTRDLKSSFNYGVGEAIARRFKIPTGSPRRSVVHALKTQGIPAAAYLLVANVVRRAGLTFAQARLRYTDGHWLDDRIQE